MCLSVLWGGLRCMIRATVPPRWHLLTHYQESASRFEAWLNSSLTGQKDSGTFSQRSPSLPALRGAHLEPWQVFSERLHLVPSNGSTLLSSCCRSHVGVTTLTCHCHRTMKTNAPAWHRVPGSLQPAEQRLHPLSCRVG